MLRSPTVIIARIGLWGMNVYFFRLFGIDYVRVLNLDLVKEREAKLLAESGTEGSVKRSNNDIEEDSKSLSKRSDFEDTQDDDTCPSTENLSAIPFGNRITWGKLVFSHEVHERRTGLLQEPLGGGGTQELVGQQRRQRQTTTTDASPRPVGIKSFLGRWGVFASCRERLESHRPRRCVSCCRC